MREMRSLEAKRLWVFLLVTSRERPHARSRPAFLIRRRDVDGQESTSIVRLAPWQS